MSAHTASLTADQLVTLVHAIDAVSQAESNLVATVRTLRGEGASWAAIGEAFGTSRQAVWERFHTKVNERIIGVD